MEAMRLSNVRARAMGMADIREDERRRVARELHDGPAQSMAGALFGIDLALGVLEQSSSAAREELLAARGLVRDALDDVRALMAGLRPRQLEERGLAVALRSLAAMPPLWGTEVTVETRGIGDDDRLPPEVELGLYRIAQEAVSNARRHGAAAHVRVLLDVRPTVAELTIADDGHGWDGRATGTDPGGGEGLPGMRERVRLLGGELHFESAPSNGAQIMVAAPLRCSRKEPGEERA